MELVHEIVFGAVGNESHHLGAGWSPAESDFRWAVGSTSEIWLENPGSGDDYIIELQLKPFRRPPELLAQRLAVEVRGSIVGRSVVAANMKVAYRVPGELMAPKGPVRVILHHKDAVAPAEFGFNDERKLAFALRSLSLYRVTGDTRQISIEGGTGVLPAQLERLTGLPATQFMMQFESLGDNCEFGLVQRRCGADPLGLLRFSYISFPQLLRGLYTRFQGIGTPDKIQVFEAGGANKEYAIRDTEYALVFHTWQQVGSIDENALREQQAKRLGFLSRKLIDDLRLGEKIFVYKSNTPTAEAEVLSLYAAINKYVNLDEQTLRKPRVLLWVVPADELHPAGLVECLIEGLLKGYIDRFAPYDNAHDLSLEVWLDLCVNAYSMVVRREGLLAPDKRICDPA